MTPKTLFSADSPVVMRQPKTDRLILGRFLKDAAGDMRLDEGTMKAAIPFGPFLALGAMIYVLWGQNIIDWYFGLLG
ncbi:MAG TPA: hypothetical protein PLR71_10670 [Deltaproteobacteria bacterium]|nr:hypothetical protein [Deltaproteobacteria bacterium]